MERLVTVSDVKERYGCSRQTARKYLRQCNPHMEKPLAAPKWAFDEWESKRVVEEPRFTYKDVSKALNEVGYIVPRRR